MTQCAHESQIGQAKFSARRAVIAASALPFIAKTFGTFAAPATAGELSELVTIIPSYPAGQIATDCEHIAIYNNVLYLLFKGTYNLTDNSFITVLRLEDDGRIREITRVDIGIGADARAMTAHNGHLYVFCKLGKQQSLLTYRLSSERPELKNVFRRNSNGFVQSCRIIKGRLYACNWGDGTVECYEFSNGISSRAREFKVGAIGNSSIVSWEEAHYLLIHANTNNLVRLNLSSNGAVSEAEKFAFGGLVLPRYGTIANGVLTVGGYSTIRSKTVALDISRGSPVKVAEYVNMPTHVRVGNYLIGACADQSTTENAAMYRKSIRVDVTTNRVTVIDERAILYPVLFQDKVYAFRSGNAINPRGTHAGDSKLGEGFTVFSTR